MNTERGAKLALAPGRPLYWIAPLEAGMIITNGDDDDKNNSSI